MKLKQRVKADCTVASGEKIVYLFLLPVRATFLWYFILMALQHRLLKTAVMKTRVTRMATGIHINNKHAKSL